MRNETRKTPKYERISHYWSVVQVAYFRSTLRGQASDWQRLNKIFTPVGYACRISNTRLCVSLLTGSA